MNTQQTQTKPHDNLYEEPDSIPINLRKYLFFFLMNWHWFLITVFIAMSTAYLKNRYTLPQYNATATLLLEEDEMESDILNEIKSVRRRRRSSDLANEIAKLNTYSLHTRTIDSLKWKIFWTGHGRIARKRPLYKNVPYLIDLDSTSSPWYINNRYYIDQQDKGYYNFSDKNSIDTLLPFNKWVDLSNWKFRVRKHSEELGYASYSFVIYSKNTLAKQHRSKLKCTTNEDRGSIIVISSSGPIIEKEIDYVNEFCKNYIASGLERKRLIAENSLEFIESQIQIIQDSMQGIENKLVSFRLNNNIVNLSTEGQLAYDKLQKFYDQKIQLKLKNSYYQYLKKYITKKRDPQAIIAPTLVDANDQLLIDQVKRLQTLYEDKEQLTFTAVEENPELLQINRKIQDSRERIIEILNGLLSNNELIQEKIKSEEETIEKQLLKLPVREQELLDIQRKYDVNNQFYTFLLQKRAEAGIQRASTISNVRILDEASIYNVQQIGTKSSLTYFFALIIGLLLPAIIIIFTDYFDTRIKDRNDIEQRTTLPIIGVVSHETSNVSLPIHYKPGSAFAESFRHIRTNLQYLLRDEYQKVIMITSTISGEGKTFIAANLATILAMNSKNVLLSGFDLRKPTLHKIFNLDNDKGISTYLAGQSELKHIIRPTNIQYLNVMIAGPIPPNPAELLQVKKMNELLKELKEQYDYIIMDTPPLAVVTDALLLSRLSDSNIFVIRQNYSHRDVLNMINDLAIDKINNVALLVNDIRLSKALGYRYYYGYGYRYGYGYGYGYGYDNDYYTNDNE